MDFIRHDDKEMLDDLVDNQVFTLADFAAMSTHEAGWLMDALIENRKAVSESEWLYWLIRRHGCIRLASVRVDREWVEEQRFSDSLLREMREASVFPVARGERDWLLAVGRPWDRQRWREALKGEPIGVAATLSELADIRDCFGTTN